MSNITLSKPSKMKLFKGAASKIGAEIILPVGRSEPSPNLEDYSVLLIGEPGLGKTTFADQYPDVVHLMFSRGGKGLGLRKIQITDWQHFLKVWEKIKKTPGYCKSISIDTGYDAYEACYNDMLKQFGVSEREDAGYGFWREVDAEFRRVQNEIEKNGITLIVLTHCDEEEIKKHGMTYHKTTPRLSKQAARYYTGDMDIIVYYQRDERENRFLVIDGDNTRITKTRTEGKFLYTDGARIAVIPAGRSAQEAYSNFVKAFNCQLINPAKKGGEIALKKITFKKS